MPGFKGFSSANGVDYIDIEMLGGGVTSIVATEQDIDGVLAWRNGALIQDALPHWTEEDRELLLTGIGAEDWDAFFDEAEDEEPFGEPYLDKYAVDPEWDEGAW